MITGRIQLGRSHWLCISSKFLPVLGGWCHLNHSTFSFWHVPQFVHYLWVFFNPLWNGHDKWIEKECTLIRMCEVINSGTYTVWVATIDKLLVKRIAIMIIMCLRNHCQILNKESERLIRYKLYGITYEILVFVPCEAPHFQHPASCQGVVPQMPGGGKPVEMPCVNPWLCRVTVIRMQVCLVPGVPRLLQNSAIGEINCCWPMLTSWFSMVCHLQLSHVCIKAFHPAVRVLNGFHSVGGHLQASDWNCICSTRIFWIGSAHNDMTNIGKFSDLPTVLFFNKSADLYSGPSCSRHPPIFATKQGVPVASAALPTGKFLSAKDNKSPGFVIFVVWCCMAH